MRFIRTTNNIAEFIETSDKTGKIISSMGFQFGEVYYQIKNGKVTFYLNDQENPFRNDIWSLNIPFVMDGVEYADEDSASAHLYAVFNDRFQEQLDQLKEDLAAEEARAQEAEAQLDDKIDDESARAIAAENRLQDQVTELSGAVAVLDNRVTNVENDLSALTDTVNDEIARSVAKDAEHDALISGLTNSLDNEIARAISAETQLHNEIINEQNRALAAESGITANLNAEIQNRIADVDAEEARALAAESGITANLNSEISRSTEKDAQHDVQISALTVSLDNEINRATTAENALRSDLNDEIADRISGDTNLQNQLDAEIARAQNAEENIDDKIDGEISRANSEETRIEGKLDNEITRSTAKDVEHDTLISGLTDDLASEVARATARENQIDANLNAEIARATNAENALESKIDAEITRSTAKDASHDTLISGLTTNLQNEINRATSAENSLRNDLNAEITRATDAEEDLDDKIDLEIQNRINAVSGLTDRVADDEAAFGAALVDLNNKINAVSGENATQNVQISGLNNSINTEISRATSVENSLRNDLTNETSARTAADTAQIERIVALEVGKADKSDLNNYYTKAESDAKYATKDYVSGLTDNFYTKGQTNELLAAKADKTDVITISGDVIALSTKVDTISGEVNTIKEEIDDIDLSNYYTKGESDGKYQLKGDYVTGAQMSAYTYDKQTIDDKIAQGGSFDPTQYYNKTATDALLAEKADLSGLTSHTANTNVHVTSAEKATWNAKSDFSGNYNDLTNKPTIHTYTAGTGIDITNDVISVTGGSQPVDAYTKAESDAKFATITNFNSHSGNTTMHVTASEKNTWNGKQNALTAGENIDITNNVISTVTKFWCGTQSQYDAISVKDPNTVYMIHE